MERQYDLNKVIPLEWKPLAAHGVIHMANPKDSIKKFVELARKICEKG